jgi:translation initiation factor IF-2
MSKSKLSRTPVVAVMGHVDHGKTSLLDAIRGTRVAAGEHGGITQNTRAHQIQTKSGQKITFIDTPGHEAFSAMRSRGAKVTDIVMLVVAADDGVQAQTKESIKFAQEAKVPIIVAVNKMDAPGANLEKIKRELSSYGVVIEEYGGDVMYHPVSAIKKEGLDDLLDGIELLAEIQGLTTVKLKDNTLAEAFVMEATMDKRIGPVALCILKAGELNTRTFGVYPQGTFKVRAYLDHNQKPIQQVFAGDPFWVTGLEKVVDTGTILYFANDEKSARTVLSDLQQNVVGAEAEGGASLDDDMLMFLLSQREAQKEGVEQKVLHVVLKASSQGTLEAVRYELEKLGDDEKTVKVINANTGEVTEDDIKRAKAAGGIVISFQSAVNPKLEKFAKQEKVIVRNYEIIYEMMEELGGALDSLIEPEETEVEIARAEVRRVFTLSDGSIVAGCMVTKGTFLKGYPVYVERPDESTDDTIAEITRGRIKSLRLLKDEVREIKKGQECGILIDPQPTGIAEGDEIVAYKLER